jgi:transposase
MTVIAALRLDGVRAPFASPGATDTAAFETYVEHVLAPTLHEGDVVVFDNLRPHLDRVVKAAIERTGARLILLPPYSPDYTPIEGMYSKVKTLLRRIAARTKGELYEAIGKALKLVTPNDIIGWFREAGLCATHP